MCLVHHGTEGFKLQLRFDSSWLLLVFLAGLFSLLYLWFTVFPGRVAPETWQFFDAGQVSGGREYSMVPRLLFIAGFLVQAAFLLWLVFGGRAAALSQWSRQAAGGNYWGSILLFFLALWLMLQLLRLPFTLYSSYFWQHRWGFSTQSLGSWWLDYLKGAGLELALTAVGVLFFFWLLNRWPGAWWLAGAALFSLWLVFQTFLWPVVVSPLFNRFVPAEDPALLGMVWELSGKARIPVDQVLIMDGSRRTTRSNAYFAGLGKTRRIVLYDTLLAKYPPDEVKAVVAHEMAHWRQGHILQGLAWGILGSFVGWGLLFALLRGAVPPTTRYPPETLAVALLFLLWVSFVSSPVQNAVSRAMEREADRVAVMLTGDVPAAIRLQVDLADKNLSDIAPPAFIRWFSYTHPPAPERIRLLQQQAGGPWP